MAPTLYPIAECISANMDLTAAAVSAEDPFLAVLLPWVVLSCQVRTTSLLVVADQRYSLGVRVMHLVPGPPGFPSSGHSSMSI